MNEWDKHILKYEMRKRNRPMWKKINPLYVFFIVVFLLDHVTEMNALQCIGLGLLAAAPFHDDFHDWCMKVKELLTTWEGIKTCGSALVIVIPMIMGGVIGLTMIVLAAATVEWIWQWLNF